MELPLAQIRALAGDDVFVQTMEGLYAALDQRIAGRGPVCQNRGDCCQFDAFGHRLFVTPVELAYFMAKRKGPLLAPTSRACPYQQSGRCTARQARPTGCRIFFCEAASQGWQPAETEATLGEIKDLHMRFGIPYAYVDWMEASRQSGREAP